MEELKEKFQEYLNEYNQIWCDKDIEKLKTFILRALFNKEQY